MTESNGLSESLNESTNNAVSGTLWNTAADLDRCLNIPGRNFEAFDVAAKALLPNYKNLPDETKTHIIVHLRR